MIEEFRVIAYDNNYAVSNLGRVLSLRRDKLLKPFTAGAGYLAVMFKFDGRKYYVHRLVAEHFVQGDLSIDVNHKDGVKTNNSAENLEWVSKSENQLHRTHVLNKRGGQFVSK